jgi:hypothetical protein
MFRWLKVEVTPVEFDLTLWVFCAGVCAFLAVMMGIYGSWLMALMYVVIAIGPLRDAWRYVRRWDAEPGVAADRHPPAAIPTDSSRHDSPP